jgi:hypothetical protein
MENFTLTFEYNGRSYSAAVGVQGTPEGKVFVVTPLDEELNRILSGNAIIREMDGKMETDVLPEKVEQTRLKLVIASRLSEYLNVPCFAGDVCLMTQAHVDNWEEFHPLLRHEMHHDASID